jgi:hypothetical protein
MLPRSSQLMLLESQVERPKHGQKHLYIVVRKHHAPKAQLVVDLTNFKIVCIHGGKVVNSID